MEIKEFKLDIISISDLLNDKPKSHGYIIESEFWIDESKKDECLYTEYTLDNVIYKNAHKNCIVHEKNGIVKKTMNKKFSSHFLNVCISCKEIGINIIYGFIVTNDNLIIFEQKIKGYPLISITSGLDNVHSNTFANNHVNVPVFKINLSKFFIFKLIYDVLEDLEKIHHAGYCHGDIHTGNIIIDIDLYKNIISENVIPEHENMNNFNFSKFPKIFTLIDFDCLFISPDVDCKLGNSSDYMIRNNRVFHSDKIGDLQRLSSIINLLISKYIIEVPHNYEFLHKTFRFCKKIKKIDSSMTMISLDPLKYFKENIYLEKSIPRNIFSKDYFKHYMLQTYNFDIDFKNIKSSNCYFVNTNSKKIGNDIWQLVRMNTNLLKNGIKVNYYYYKEVFIVDIPQNLQKEKIKEICGME